MAWISVRNWRKFQHYDPTKRRPPWIKVYTELMADDDWLALSGYDRAVLCCLWLEYASSRCRLPADTRSLTRQLNLRVTSATLDRLSHAGFIDIVASKALAEGYLSASARAHDVEVEIEKDKEPSFLPTSTYNGGRKEGTEKRVRPKTEAELVAERELPLPGERPPQREPAIAEIPSAFQDMPL